MKKFPIAIIIPTWNNFQYLQPCLNSLLANNITDGLFHVYVINNGHENSCDFAKSDPRVTVIDAGENLGWEGALKLGLKKSNSELVVFLNDDTLIPSSSLFWLHKMAAHFADMKVGAVGPSSNVVMGPQNIFVPTHPDLSVKYLIGFCMMVRRSTLEEVGGVDDSLPGGDDLDLSIRLRKAGYTLLVDKHVFVFHHGFKTGERIHGTYERPGGWNSYEFKEKTDVALIKKHGFRAWYETLRNETETRMSDSKSDSEGNLIRSMLSKEEKILELGVGGTKTREDVVGVDIVPKGETIDTINNVVSVADVVADVTKPLPFEEDSFDCIIARHILEHVDDPISVLRQWYRVIKPGGYIIVAVPDIEIFSLSVVCNIEHLHAFTRSFMKQVAKAAGLYITEVVNPENGISIIYKLERNI